MKYIVIRTKVGSLTKDIPIIFPNDLSHVDVANAVIEKVPEAKDGKPVSAGAISSTAIDADMVSPEGSVSLKMKRGNERDGIMIQLYDYVHGFVDEEPCEPIEEER